MATGKPLHTRINGCRICDKADLRLVLDLGRQPPANSLRSQIDKPLPTIPLELMRCAQCGTLQLSETVDPEYLFRHYVWVTGTARTSREFSQVFCEQMLGRCARRRSLFVVEAASNDGTFLAAFKSKGHRVLGVDPAENIAVIANGRGIPTWACFFGQDLARRIVSECGRADCIIVRNVIPHVMNVHDVMAGITLVLAEDGVGAVEFHYARKILEGLQYDSIYHEHLCYYSLTSMRNLLQQHGLHPFDVTGSPISGGALIVYFAKNDRSSSPAMENMLSEERTIGLNTAERWTAFAGQCLEHRTRLKNMIVAELKGGARLIGYGASARSSTLLNFCGINSEHLLCIADQNEIKHGKLTPGTDIPIISPEAAFSRQPDGVLLLAWNFRDEIVFLLKDRFGFKGKVIVPLPGASRTVVV